MARELILATSEQRVVGEQLVRGGWTKLVSNIPVTARVIDILLCSAQSGKSAVGRKSQIDSAMDGW